MRVARPRRSAALVDVDNLESVAGDDVAATVEARARVRDAVLAMTERQIERGRRRARAAAP